MTAPQNILRVQDLLQHIDAAALLAQSYVSGMTKAEFLNDKRTQQAVIYNILIVGEAATCLTNAYPEFVEAHREVPWREMRGIRNRMAHGYYELDLDVVWDTVTLYLDELSKKINRCLKEC